MIRDVVDILFLVVLPLGIPALGILVFIFVMFMHGPRLVARGSLDKVPNTPAFNYLLLFVFAVLGFMFFLSWLRDSINHGIFSDRISLFLWLLTLVLIPLFRSKLGRRKWNARKHYGAHHITIRRYNR